MEEIKHLMDIQELPKGYDCKTAILRTLHYKPEILILGTFNPYLPGKNYADFFYGRNYLWPALMNLFKYNKGELLGPRMPKNGKPKKELKPSLDEILELCEELKLTFADLILSVLHQDNPNYHMLDNGNVCYANQTFNLIQDDKKDQVSGLVQLDKRKQVNWNTSNIINYLKDNPQITKIYFTRQPTKVWKKKWEEIKNNKCISDRIFTNILHNHLSLR